MKKTAVQVMIICFLLGAVSMYTYMKYYHTDSENRSLALAWYYDTEIVKNARSNPNTTLTPKEINYYEGRAITENASLDLDWKLRITAESYMK